MKRTMLRSLQAILMTILLIVAMVSLPDIASADQYLRYSSDNTYQVQPSLDLSNLKVGKKILLSTDYSNSIYINDDTPSNIRQPKIHCNDSSPPSSSGRISSGNPDYEFELYYNNIRVDCRNGAAPFYRSSASSNQTMGITPMKLFLVKVGDTSNTARLRYPNFQMCKRQGSQSDYEQGCFSGERNGLSRYYPSYSTAAVIIKPPIKDTSLTKAFSPASINEGETSTLTFTITENTQDDTQDNKVSFTDTLRSGLVIATPANLQKSCTGGTITANDGDTTIKVTDTVLSDGSPSCSISVDVTAATQGSYINGASDMSGLVGIDTSTMTDHTLTVVEPINPDCDKDLIQNGSFETPVTTLGHYPSIPGWNLLDGSSIEIQHNLAGKPSEGAQLVELDSNGVSGIYQDIPTQPGQTYTLTFAFSARPNVAQNKLNVRWGDTLVAQLEKNGSGLWDTEWQVYSYELTATDSSTRLSFDDLDELSDGQGSYIDAVSLILTCS